MGGTTMPLVDWSKQSGGGSAPNMLGMVEQAMKIRQTGQEFAARQRFGQIMAGTGGDIDEALKQAQADPTVGAFAPQLMSELRQQQLLGSQTEQMRLSVGKSAREGMMGVLQAAGNDPTKLVPALQSQFATYDRRTQELSKPYGDAIVTSLTAGLPADPVAAQQEFARRKALLMVSTGALPNVGVAAGAAGFGIPGVHDVPGVGPTGTMQDPFTGRLQVGTGSGTGGGPPPGGALAPSPAPAGGGEAVPGGTLALPTPAQPSTPPPAAGGSSGDLAGDGKLLYHPSMVAPGVTYGTGGTGAPILSAPQQKLSDRLAEDYGAKGYDQFQAAQQTQASLAQMDAAFDNLAKGGGFLQPGPTAQFRGQVAGLVNTFAQIAGKEPPFDPSKVADIEEMNKETRRMGLQVMNQYLGGSREAAETIRGITASVPGVDNTYMGGKLVIAGIRAMNQRVIDQRNFQDSWMNDHGGNLLGADVAFNRAHPAREYANRALDEFGLKPDGTFKNPEAVRDAKDRGLLTPKQAQDALVKNFPDKFH